jgi:hypothetical protein
LVLIAAAGAIAVAVLAWWFTRAPAHELNEIDLVEAFPEAEKRTNVPSLEMAFSIEDVTIDGERKRCIFATPSSRILWDVYVPERGVIETFFALRPDAWDKRGNGVQFRIGVADSRGYDEPLRQHVDPAGRAVDRMWHHVVLDLSSYQGRKVKIIFNTDPGPSGRYGDADTENDFSVWCEPRVYSHR